MISESEQEWSADFVASTTKGGTSQPAHRQYKEARFRVAYALPSLETGGLQRAVLTTTKYLHGNEAAVAIIALRPSPTSSTMDAEFQALGVPVICLGLAHRAERHLPTFIRAVAGMRRVFRELDIDLVDSAVLEADLSSRVACLASGVTHVTHLINTTYEIPGWQTQSRGAIRRYGAIQLDRLSGRSSSSFIAISEAVRQSYIRVPGFPESKITVIPRGVDRTHFRALEAPAPSSIVRFGIAGRLVKGKGVDVAISAVANCKARGETVRLSICGDGPEVESLRQLAAHLGVGGQVDFESFRSDIVGFYRTIDALIMPSRHEGLGNTLIEAMACGRPALVSDIDTFREVARNSLGCLFSDPGDAGALADRMMDFCQSPPGLRRAMGDANERRVREAYDARANCLALLEHYTALAGRSRRATE